MPKILEYRIHQVYHANIKRPGNKKRMENFSGKILQRRRPGGNWKPARKRYENRMFAILQAKESIPNLDWAERLINLPRRTNERIKSALLDAQIEIMEHADKARGYHNLTGNTITSTVSGVYFGLRKPVLMGLPSVNGRRPTRPKFRGKKSGKYRYRSRWFDNPNVWRSLPAYMVVETSGKYADKEVRERLSGLKLPNTGKTANVTLNGKTYTRSYNRVSGFILDVGVEYKDILESKGLNVVGETKKIAGKVVSRHIRSILRNILKKK